MVWSSDDKDIDRLVIKCVSKVRDTDRFLSGDLFKPLLCPWRSHANQRRKREKQPHFFAVKTLLPKRFHDHSRP